MDKKVILILVDGMRPDAVLNCGEPWVNDLIAGSLHTFSCRTVMPSVTLPCHMSLFHSVDPQRHGVTTNTWAPQVRPIEGLVERLDREGKKCGFFITWEELRDLARPDHLAICHTLNLHKNERTDIRATDSAIEWIGQEQPDFTFLYLGETDEVGHAHGWMGPEYLASVANALRCVRRVREAFGDSYDIILTADHGGHDRTHGTEADEDMTTPVFLLGPDFPAGVIDRPVSIKDLAPTIVRLTGCTPAKEWEGTSVI